MVRYMMDCSGTHGAHGEAKPEARTGKRLMAYYNYNTNIIQTVTVTPPQFRKTPIRKDNRRKVHNRYYYITKTTTTTATKSIGNAITHASEYPQLSSPPPRSPPQLRGKK
ncbi:hypothetical protein E2C01_086482 [Portunus trituberculatus]|uniref:Uncharacterized protein n=1 Tax=Portunus trituberculatus TaxID=210409 RepID=A0A5B7JGG1_PORTR|nr:hypothetical protein [Portunus trituberculatus]